IEKDFNKRFSDGASIIYRTWKKIATAIVQESKERKINLLENLTFNDIGICALLTLPYLFSPVTLKKSRKGVNWRPTRSEVQESFFLNIS
ncbi:hypothetical protein FQR65_LT20749, partial [Abscondita terminalis]